MQNNNKKIYNFLNLEQHSNVYIFLNIDFLRKYSSQFY